MCVVGDCIGLDSVEWRDPLGLVGLFTGHEMLSDMFNALDKPPFAQTRRDWSRASLSNSLIFDSGRLLLLDHDGFCVVFCFDFFSVFALLLRCDSLLCMLGVVFVVLCFVFALFSPCETCVICCVFCCVLCCFAFFVILLSFLHSCLT